MQKHRYCVAHISRTLVKRLVKMDINLQKMILYFSVYGSIGVVWLFNGYLSKSKIEQLCCGIALILHTAFLLSLITIVSSSLIELANSPKTTEYIDTQVKQFLPYVAFLSSVFTFLFGGVGTNLVSAAIIKNEDLTLVETISRLESRVARVEKSLKKNHSVSIVRLVFSVIFSLVGLVVLYKLLN